MNSFLYELYFAVGSDDVEHEAVFGGCHASAFVLKPYAQLLQLEHSGRVCCLGLAYAVAGAATYAVEPPFVVNVDAQAVNIHLVHFYPHFEVAELCVV